MKKSFVIILLIFTASWMISCGSYGKPTPPMPEKEYNEKLAAIYRAENFDPNKTYEPLSLHVDGKPLAVLGLRLNDLKKDFSMTPNYTGDYYEMSEIVSEYFTMSRKLEFESGKDISGGSLYLSVGVRTGVIFKVGGSWTLNHLLDDEEAMKMSRESLVTDRFPILKDKLELKDGWEFTHERETMTEHFEVVVGVFMTLRYKITPK